MERSEAFHILNWMYDEATEEQRKALDMAMSDIEFVDLMPDEIAPVVHGRWIWSEENECWVCSNCEMSALNNYRGNSTDSNYCPNCGAKMDME